MNFRASWPPASLQTALARHSRQPSVYILVGAGPTALPDPLDQSDDVLERRKAHGEGYGRRKLIVRLQVPD